MLDMNLAGQIMAVETNVKHTIVTVFVGIVCRN